MKTVDFSETIAASELKVGRCKQLIEFMKVCEYIHVIHFERQIGRFPFPNREND